MKINRNRKALSPIFATLIILAIVTVLFIPVFIWSTGLTAETKSFWHISGEIATERIVIEEVNLRGGIPNCMVYVRNIGKTAVTVNDVFISSPSGSLYIYEKADFTADPDSVVQGDLTTITISNLGGFNPVSNVAYTVKVYTSRGVGDTYQVKA